MLRNTAANWGSVAKALHWSMAVLILAQLVLGVLAVGWGMSPTKLDLFVWHKSLGVLLLVAVLLRLAWRWVNPTPVLPPELPAWERAAARIGHALLYVLMLVLPLTGWLLNSAAAIPLRVFWLVPLPPLIAPDEALGDTLARVHDAAALLLVVLLVLHVAAALRHHWVRRNVVLSRMLPGRHA